MADRIGYEANQQIIWRFAVTQAGLLQTGLVPTMTVTLYDEAGAAFALDAGPTEVTLGGSGRGVYEVRFTPDAAGEWSMTMAESSLPIETAWNFHVVTESNKTAIDNVYTDTQQLLVDVAAVKAETALILADTTQLLVDVAAVKAETALILADTTQLLLDVAAVKADTVAIIAAIAAMQVDVTALIAAVAAVQADVTTIIATGGPGPWTTGSGGSVIDLDGV